MKKNFKNFSSQIKLLEDRGLLIKSHSVLTTFLKTYNYEHCINGYNDPFFHAFDRKTNKYQIKSSSEQIIEFFMFDEDLKKIFMHDLLLFEQKFSTGIIYYLHEKIQENSHFKKMSEDEKKKIINGDLFEISLEELKLLCFENFNLLIDKKNKKVECNSLLNELQVWEIFKKSCITLNKENKTKVSIWKSCLSWTFGLKNDFFLILSNDIKKKIISSCFNIKKEVSEEIYPCFFEFIYALQLIRNKIFHNDVLYNKFSGEKQSKYIHKIYVSLIDSKKINNKIYLNDIYEILIILINKKNWKSETKNIKNLFSKSLKTLNPEQKQYIKNKIFGSKTKI